MAKLSFLFKWLVNDKSTRRQCLIESVPFSRSGLNANVLCGLNLFSPTTNETNENLFADDFQL